MPAKVRKLITCYRIHLPRADIERLYAKRNKCLKINSIRTDKQNNRGWNKEYLDATTDWMLQFVNTLENQKKKFSL